jgi:hypothetical protein
METQNAVARYFRENGWPYAESAGSGRPGVDILGMPGLACEVKGRRDLNLGAWLRQAEGYPGLPFVVHRPDGVGLTRVELWPTTFRLKDATILLNLYNGREMWEC